MAAGPEHAINPISLDLINHDLINTLINILIQPTKESTTMNELLGIGTLILTGIGSLFVALGAVDLFRPMPKHRP